MVGVEEAVSAETEGDVDAPVFKEVDVEVGEGPGETTMIGVATGAVAVGKLDGKFFRVHRIKRLINLKLERTMH